MRSSVLTLAAGIARLLPGPMRRALYRLGPLPSLIRRMLNKSAPAGFAEVQIAAGGLYGMKMALDLQSEKSYWLGTYEPELEMAVGEFVKPGMVVYDAGANIGYVSLMLARAVGSGGHVYAFEALPGNLDRLEKNLALNELLERVTIVPGAVTDKGGPVDFLVHRSGAMGRAVGSASGGGAAFQEEITVSGLSLDGFVYERSHPVPQVVKMDIEGGEAVAVSGMERLLVEAHPVMLVELHSQQAAKAVCECLWETGYGIQWMADGYPAVESYESLGRKAYIIAR